MFIDVELLGLVLTYLGEMLLGIAVIIVHSRIRRERKIDWAVLHELDIDRALTMVALTILSAGFVLMMVAKATSGAQ
jgi:hypothetical protein